MSYERRFKPIGASDFDVSEDYTVTGDWTVQGDWSVEGDWTFSEQIISTGEGAYLHHVSSTYPNGRVTVSTSTPTGGASGDLWIQVDP